MGQGNVLKQTEVWHSLNNSFFLAFLPVSSYSYRKHLLRVRLPSRSDSLCKGFRAGQAGAAAASVLKRHHRSSPQFTWRPGPGTPQGHSRRVSEIRVLSVGECVELAGEWIQGALCHCGGRLGGGERVRGLCRVPIRASGKDGRVAVCAGRKEAWGLDGQPFTPLLAGLVEVGLDLLTW